LESVPTVTLKHREEARASSKHCSVPYWFFNRRLLKPVLLFRSALNFSTVPNVASGGEGFDAAAFSDSNCPGSRRYRSGSRASFSAYMTQRINAVRHPGSCDEGSKTD
jgi:hypothetical protein